MPSTFATIERAADAGEMDFVNAVPRHSGPSTGQDRIGRPLPRGFRDVSLPAALRSHPQIAEQWYYTLPGQLWEALSDDLGTSRFDPEQLALDRQLAELADSTPGCVGFRDGQPVIDLLLRPPRQLNLSSPFVAAYFADVRRAGSRTEGLTNDLPDRLESLIEHKKAYLGWLFTDPTFLEEYGDLLRAHRALFESGRIPPQPMALIAQAGGHLPPGFQPHHGDPTSLAADAFCRRWRLDRLVGPATLQPLSLQFPAALPSLSAAHAQSSGSLLFIPDIAPLPDRDTLRSLIAETVRQTTASAPHLAAWFEVVAPDNQGRQTLHRYARWYPLQHYLRVLYSRHHAHLHRAQTSIERIVGDSLGLSGDKLRKDLQAIRGRLDRRWFMPPAGA
ncbi:MAG TPA: hypothetical protein VM165_19290 [Planctomycetaceae bacterium]|nr:hypothetical protein [Planctomycetaceae bacterium]